MPLPTLPEMNRAADVAFAALGMHYFVEAAGIRHLLLLVKPLVCGFRRKAPRRMLRNHQPLELRSGLHSVRLQRSLLRAGNPGIFVSMPARLGSRRKASYR